MPPSNQFRSRSSSPANEPYSVDPALAASMGFTGFGMQPAAKKRRYNPATEVVADIQLSTPYAATGSNAGSIGQRGGNGVHGLPARPPHRMEGRLEGGARLGAELGVGHGKRGGVYGDERNRDLGRGSNAMALGVKRTTAPGQDDGLVDAQGPSYVEDTPPPRSPHVSDTNTDSAHRPHVADGEGSTNGSGPPRRTANGNYDWTTLRRGVRNERGDMAYYDASFVEDPWRGLKT